MEAMNQWEETEEEAAAAAGTALRRKLPHQHSNTANLATTVSQGDFIFSSSESSLASGEAEEAEEVKETPSNDTPISHKNGGTESPYEISGFSGGHVDFSFRKNPGDEILDVKVVFDESAVSITNRQDVGDAKVEEELNGSGTLSSKQSVEQNGRDASGNNGTTEPGGVKLREISEQEASELYLERVYQKPAAHDFYCPNCNSCITKVIIRGREPESTLPPAAPPPPLVDPIRCTSCFSFLIPAGSWFFPKLEHKDEDDHTKQETNIGKGVEVGELIPVPSHDSAGTLQDQNSQTAPVSKGPAPEEPVGATAIVEPSRDNIQGSVGVEGLDETQYDKSPAMPAQPIGVGDTASIDKPIVTGESVEASVGAKPSGNNFESGVEVEESVPSHESNGTVLDKKPSVPVLPVGVGVLVTTKPPASQIDVVAISREPVQIQGSDAGPTTSELPESTVVVISPEPTIIRPETGDTTTLEIVKSIVYGGLTEAITSLGIVTSAASADTATLNILALALANLLGGLFIIGHNLWELKDDHSKVPSGETDEEVERYQKVLGKRENFPLHASIVILSFIVFGLIPPVVYSFSFLQSNNRDLKIAAVAVTSFLCIMVLAIGKAYIQRPPKYMKTLLYYITIVIGVGGVSYLAGDLIDILLEKLGWFPSTESVSLLLPQMNIVKPSLESY
ncbi:membrane protein of ER body-like protein [Pyrus communis]|uniref:membrane protein of ER body-like protein n=1 Tax=Pyrus communis TaxID=23211 RepID=UPI0035C120AE